MIMISKFLFNFSNFCIITLGFLFSTVVDAVFVAKLLTSGILPSIAVILVLQSVFLTRPLALGIFFSNSVLFSFYLVSSYFVFKTDVLVSILFTLATNLSYAVF